MLLRASATWVLAGCLGTSSAFAVPSSLQPSLRSQSRPRAPAPPLPSSGSSSFLRSGYLSAPTSASASAASVPRTRSAATLIMVRGGARDDAGGESGTDGLSEVPVWRGQWATLAALSFVFISNQWSRSLL